MKLMIKMIDLHNTGRAVPLLCDEDGNVIPCQVQTSLDSGQPRDRPMFTVSFLIDGKNIVSE